MRLGVVILAVSDVVRSVAFYRQALEWQQVVDVPVYAELRSADGLRLGLYQRDAYALNTGAVASPAPAGVPTATELYFFATDVPAALERFTAAGALLLSPLAARQWGDEAAYLTDPDGNVVVVARPLPAG